MNTTIRQRQLSRFVQKDSPSIRSRSGTGRVVLSALFIFSAFGCQSKETQQTTQQAPAKGDLLSRVPLNSYGVFISKTGSDVMRNFRKTAWGKPSRYSLDQLKNVQSEQAEQAAKVMSILAESEFATAFGLAEGESTVTEIIAFAAPRGESVSFGAFAAAKDGTDFLPLFDKAVAQMKQNSVAVKDIQPSNPKVVAIPIEGQKNTLNTVYVAATKERVAFATDQGELTRIFVTDGPTDTPPLLEKGSFKIAYAKGLQEDVLSFAHLDIRDVAKHLSSMSTAAQKVDSEQEGPVDPQELQKALESLPLENLTYFRRINDSMTDEVLVQLMPHTEKQREVLTTLAELKPHDLLQSAPPSFVLLLGADVDYFVKLAEKFPAEVGSSEADSIAPILNYLKDVDSLNIGLRQGKGGSPFPDIAIFLASPQPDQLYEQLKMLVMLGIKSSPLKNLQWLKKQVEGLDVDYALSPFGVGVFLAKTSNHIVFSSSEAGLVSVARSFKEGGDNLWKNLPETVRLSLGNEPGFFSYAADLGEFADLLRSLQTSLSMFTGGQSPLKEEDVTRLKSLGTVVGTARFRDNNTFEFKAVYELAKPPAA
jgi:hypothetical protein